MWHPTHAAAEMFNAQAWLCRSIALDIKVRIPYPAVILNWPYRMCMWLQGLTALQLRRTNALAIDLEIVRCLQAAAKKAKASPSCASGMSDLQYI